VIAATGSTFTHCGVVMEKDGKLMVLEAVGPVRFITIEDFARSSQKGTFVIKRLVKSQKLNPAALAKASAYGTAQLGRPYSGQFRWDDETLYCSELVWKWFAAAGIRLVEPQRMGNYNLKAPAVLELIVARYGSVDALPLDEPVVAPSDLANSPHVSDVTPR